MSNESKQSVIKILSCLVKYYEGFKHSIYNDM